MTWQIYDVKGDGNCFYYALYGAAKHAGLLNIVAGVLAHDPHDPKSCKCRCRCRESQEMFAVCMRNTLSSIIDERVPSRPFRTFRAFKKEMANIVKSSPPRSIPQLCRSMRESFGKIADAIPLVVNSPRDFRKKVSACIRKDKTWVTQLEIEMIRDLLRKAGVDLLPIISIGTYPPLMLSPRIAAANQLQLVYTNGNHYMYMGYGKAARHQRKELSA